VFIKELSQIPGVSGNEHKVRDFIKEKLSLWGIKYYTDSLGNLYAFKEGEKNKEEKGLMLSAHMDEVGLMVSSIEKSGHLRFYKVGGINEKALVSKPVCIGENNIVGIIGAKAVHLQKKEEREKALEVESLYIDIGAKSKEDAEKAVKVGDYVSFWSEGDSCNGVIKGKALDNRAGCAALLEILQRDYPLSFTAVFTVQEEVGLRGARVAAYRVNPKIALVIETTAAVDIPEAKEKDYSTCLGAGAAFTIKDESFIADSRVLERLIEVAENLGKPYQFRRFGDNFTEGGAFSLAGKGVAAGVISTPCRYIHSPISMLLRKDWESLVEITDAFIRSIEEKELKL